MYTKISKGPYARGWKEAPRRCRPPCPHRLPPNPNIGQEKTSHKIRNRALRGRSLKLDTYIWGAIGARFEVKSVPTKKKWVLQRQHFKCHHS